MHFLNWLVCLLFINKKDALSTHTSSIRKLGQRFLVFYFLGFDAQKMFFLGSDVQEKFSLVFPFFILAMRKLVVSEQSSGGQLTRQN